VGGTFRLGQHHAIEPTPDYRKQVAVTERRIQCVYADVAFAASRFFQGLDDRLPRGDFFAYRYRILEIQNYRISTDAEYLFDLPRVVTRGKKHCT
jgi:hypothetical protein